MCDGISDELEGIDLGDVRLNRRSKEVLKSLAANAESSVNMACQTWADTIGAYRFFNNPEVTAEKILEPHRQATVERMRAQPVVLIVQDTTELDLTKHAPVDVRHLNNKHRRGVYLHDHIAVSPDKICLGVVGMEAFDRDVDSLGKTLERRTLPIEEKESFRWLKGYRLACELAAECPGTQVVSVADREGDIYDIFVDAAIQNEPRAEYVIRAQEDRSTFEPKPEVGPKVYGKVREEVRKSPLRETRALDLCATPKRAARQTKVEIRAVQVQVKPPHARAYLPSVTHNVVLVEEVGGPNDGTDVCWLLITTLPIKTLEEILRVVQYYLARWVVEIFFRTLKTGCRVEDIQLETKHRFLNCLALYHIIAWRVLSLTYLNRIVPDISCTALFTDSEWKATWRVVKRQKLPKKPPRLGELMTLIACLGGYNNRAKEPPPGPEPIWVGIRRMVDFAIAWEAFGPES